MQFNILDANFQATEVIDEFQSAIWTERFIGYGDTQIVIAESNEKGTLLTEGTFVQELESDEVMLIDTALTEEGLHKVTGKSLLAIFQERIFRTHLFTNMSVWMPDDDLLGPAEMIADVVDAIVGAGSPVNIQLAHQALANLLYDVDDDVIAYSSPGISDGMLYDKVIELATAYQVGVALYLGNVVPATDNYNLFFKAYYGRDLTSSQSVFPVVRFSPNTDSLTNIKKLNSIDGYKTHCYAYAPDFDDGVNPPSVLPPAIAYVPGGAAFENFDRREMMIEVSEATYDNYTTTGNIATALAQKAADALANNNYVKIIDGEVVPQSDYLFGRDYKLGDIIELDSGEETFQTARITEFIRAQDQEGERAYPTISVLD
jgi:Siphovirus ReqiPepy6 Gp37-like protein